MRKLGAAAMVCMLALVAALAQAEGPLWSSIPEAAAGRSAPGRRLSPGRYAVLALDRAALSSLLDRAPRELTEAARTTFLPLSLPLPDGTFVTFRVESTAVMSPVMQARFPEIRTFKGEGVADPALSAQFELTPRGLHATIVSREDTVVVEPWGLGDIDRYVSYNLRDRAAPEGSALVVVDAAPVVEGNTGTTDMLFDINLTPASANTVTVTANTADGTATLADNDYLQVLNQVVTFNPGDTVRTITVSAVGDLQPEANETLAVVLSNPTGGAGIGDGNAVGTIINDDFAGPASLGDLVHDSRDTVALESQSGQPRPRVWTINQEAFRSYEVIVDAITGDVAAGVLQLERLANDGVTVLQSGGPVAGGSALSLRFKNSTGTPVGNQFIRVVSAGCVSCGQSDTVRVRAYDTTYRVSRFNNSASQITLLVVSNPTAQPIQGTAAFFRADGTQLAAVAFNLAPRGVFISNTSTIPGVGGTSGSILISSDAPFGALTGKAVAVEPATGFTFDTAMVPRTASTKMVPRDN